MKHMILTLLLLLMSANVVDAQNNSSAIEFSAVTKSKSPLSITTNHTVQFHKLRPGINYLCISDIPSNTTNIIPYHGDESFEPGELLLEGHPGDQVLIRFLLPAKLVPVSGYGYIIMSYNKHSANWLDQASGYSNYFNPMDGRLITLSREGTATIYLGGNPTVGSDAMPGDEYLGYGIVFAEYTGLSL